MSVLITNTVSNTTIDVTDDVRAARYSYDEHGCATAIVTLRALPRSTGSALTLQSKLTITEQSGGVAWGGRIEEVESTADGVTLVAYGGWRALGDALYTAFWSSTSYADWYMMSNETGWWYGQRWEMDSNNRLYMSPRVGETFGGMNSEVCWGFTVPHRSSRNITRISFDYDLSYPTAEWDIIVVSSPGILYTPLAASSLANVAAGPTAAGTFVWDLPSPMPLIFIIGRKIGAPITYTSPTHTHFARCTNVRVTSATPPIRSSDIMRHVFETAQVGNTAWLTSAVIDDTGDDITDATYEDADPRQIIDDLARRNDMIAAVNADGALRVSPILSFDDSARWRIAPHAAQISRSIDEQVSHAYARYRSPAGFALRTTTTASSIADAMPFRRTRMIDTQTTSLTSAESLRNAFLATADDPSIRIRIRAKHGDIWSKHGGRAYGMMLRAYDVIEIDGVHTITPVRIGRVTVDALTGETEIETLSLSDTLETALARR